MKPKLTYEERAVVNYKTATAQCLKEVVKDYAVAEKCARNMEKSSIEAANACRAVGIKLQTLCGHEQISFEFWQANGCDKKLPFSFNAAKIFIAIARKLPEKVKTLKEAAPFMQMVFLSTDLLELSEREEQHRAITVGEMQRFLLLIDLVRKPFSKLVADCPMEKWKPSQLDEFLSQTEWLDLERGKAMKLRGEEYRK